MSFFERLEKETAQVRAELYSSPQIADAVKGEISKESYFVYLTQAYHHVKHTVYFLLAMGARLPEEKRWLHDYIIEYLNEEKGHEEWILNDLVAIGGNREEIRKSAPHLETQAMNAYNYNYIERQNPVGFLGMVFMLESTSVQTAHAAAESIKKSLNLKDNAFSYLYSHGSLDIKHMEFFKELINKIDDPADQAAILEVAKNTFRLFAGVIRSIPHK